MKTLIFNGSPRKNGETAYMIRTLQENLGGDFKVVNAYRADIRPCIDCRWCFDHAGCAVKDEWQEVLSYIEECDHIIMASPVYCFLLWWADCRPISAQDISVKKNLFLRRKQEQFCWQQEVSDPEKKRKVRQRCCFVRWAVTVWGLYM